MTREIRCFDYYRKGKHTILPTMQAVHSGFDRQGIACDKSYRAGHKYDFALCWGQKQDERLREFWTGPVLYVELGYIGPNSGRFDSPGGYADVRRYTSSFCWNGTHGLGFDYLPASVPSDRFEALGVSLRPWRLNPHGRIVILGQTALDPVAIPPGETQAWNEKLVPQAEAIFGKGRVDFRPHPRYTDFASAPVRVACDGVQRAITYSSTSAIETVFAGIPTTVLSPISIAWPVCSHSMTEKLVTPDRTQWAYRLAYKQYTQAEIESGLFWEYVKRGLG